MAINIVALTGRLGKSPEIKRTASDVPYCNFSIAVDRNYKAGDERATDWINCQVWRSSAEFLGKFFHKGDSIGITGTLETRSWETDGGEKRTTTYVNVSQISFVGGKSNGNGGSDQPAATVTTSEPFAFDSDGLPF